MLLLQGEELQCSVGWNFIASRHLHILLYFLLSFAVHLIELPMVLLGGQPRSWGMDLGLCPMCLDDLWVPMQRISAKLLFFSQYTVWHLQGFSSCPLLWLPTVTLLRLLNSVSVLHSHQRWHSFLVQPATSLLFKNNSACSCFSYPKLSVEKARPLSFGPFCRLCLVNIHTNNLPSALWCDGQTMFHAPCDQNRFTFITFTGTQWS